MRVYTAVTLFLMSLVIVGLLFIHYYRNRSEVTTMTYEQFQRIW